MIKGVLLDVDGSLIDSNGAHARAWVEALEGVGISLPIEHVRREIGKGGDKLLWELVGIDEHSVAGEAISAHRRAIFSARYAPDLAPTPGARALVVALRARGLKLVVATSASAEEIDVLLTQAKVRDLLPDAVTSSEVARSKPDPDVVQAAMAHAGLPPHEVVLVGDTPYDVEAGRRAGVRVIALTCGGWDARALRFASAIFKDPADLLEHLEESPIAPPRRANKRRFA